MLPPTTVGLLHELKGLTELDLIGDDRDATALSDEAKRYKLAFDLGRRSVYTDLSFVFNRPPNGDD